MIFVLSGFWMYPYVNLSNEERNYIHQVMNESGTPKTLRNRCNILLMSDESVGTRASQDEISKRCGVCDVTVYQTIRDYCRHGIKQALRRKSFTSPSIEPIVTGDVEARIIAVACGEPPEGFSRWTVRMLTNKIIELGIVETVGRETVRKTLKKLNSNPT
jgi:transposase